MFARIRDKRNEITITYAFSVGTSSTIPKSALSLSNGTYPLNCANNGNVLTSRRGITLRLTNPKSIEISKFYLFYFNLVGSSLSITQSLSNACRLLLLKIINRMLENWKDVLLETPLLFLGNDHYFFSVCNGNDNEFSYFYCYISSLLSLYLFNRFTHSVRKYI